MDFNTLQAACLSCQKCSLCQTRTHVVFGMGTPHAEVMFIGEGPGRNEDEQGLPFVGRSGQLLDKYLAAIHLKREDIFITNIVKCRPPENRDPTPQEWEACMPYLREQFRLIRPQKLLSALAALPRSAYPAGFQCDERAWPVDGKGRHFVHRNTASRGAAAQPQPEACRLWRLCCPA